MNDGSLDEGMEWPPSIILNILGNSRAVVFNKYVYEKYIKDYNFLLDGSSSKHSKPIALLMAEEDHISEGVLLTEGKNIFKDSVIGEEVHSNHCDAPHGKNNEVLYIYKTTSGNSYVILRQINCTRIKTLNKFNIKLKD